MNNALIFYYNIYVDSINKINENYYFLYQSNNYIITPYNRDINEVSFIYSLNLEMIEKSVCSYRIIPTKDGRIIFIDNNIYYILMMLPNINNRTITYEDILKFKYIPIDNKIITALDKSNWPLYWEKKIDYFEYQFLQLENKYPIIKESINYYIGMWENAISYYNDNVVFDGVKEVCHKRVGVDTDILEFYNPLNLIIDYKERDISEYLKSFVLNENFTIIKLNEMLNKLNLDRNRIVLLISRTLFPSYYFDMYEEIVIDQKEESKLYKTIDKRTNQKTLLKVMFDMYKDYNIPFISWIIKD